MGVDKSGVDEPGTHPFNHSLGESRIFFSVKKRLRLGSQEVLAEIGEEDAGKEADAAVNGGAGKEVDAAVNEDAGKEADAAGNGDDVIKEADTTGRDTGKGVGAVPNDAGGGVHEESNKAWK